MPNLLDPSTFCSVLANDLRRFASSRLEGRADAKLPAELLQRLDKLGLQCPLEDVLNAPNWNPDWSLSFGTLSKIISRLEALARELAIPGPGPQGTGAMIEPISSVATLPTKSPEVEPAMERSGAPVPEAKPGHPLMDKLNPPSSQTLQGHRAVEQLSKATGHALTAAECRELKLTRARDDNEVVRGLLRAIKKVHPIAKEYVRMHTASSDGRRQATVYLSTEPTHKSVGDSHQETLDSH